MLVKLALMFKQIKDSILDASVYFSFDASGFRRHQKDFQYSLEELTFSGPVLITGGTSGIGKSMVEFLLTKNVPVIATGRNLDKAKDLKERGADLKVLDMADWDRMDAFVEDCRQLHAVVCNAGGMPEKFNTNDYGVELQMASQLYGHYFLLRRLIEAGKLVKGGRIVWVSSGGMYLNKLHLDNIESNAEYDKVSTYANVKRAQVVLNQELKTNSIFSDYHVNAMHPGWVATPGVSESIPKFEEMTRNRLRQPIEGGDTILWLISQQGPDSSGGFYFDRKEVSPYAFWWTREKPEVREKLLHDLVERYEYAFKS